VPQGTLPLVKKNEDKRRLLLVGVWQIVWKMKKERWLEFEMASRDSQAGQYNPCLQSVNEIPIFGGTFPWL
jgi:hypothetical protein